MYYQLIPEVLAKEVAKHTSLTRMHLENLVDEGNAVSVDTMLRSLVNLRTLSFKTVGEIEPTMDVQVCAERQPAVRGVRCVRGLPTPDGPLCACVRAYSLLRCSSVSRGNKPSEKL